MDGHSESDVLEEITRGGLPSHVRAELVADRAAPPRFDADAVEPCPVFYSVNGKIFPERCQLAAGHQARTSTANHYHGAIGWWS